MFRNEESDYRRLARAAVTVVLIAFAALLAPVGALAQSAGGVQASVTLNFQTGEDGKGYYQYSNGYGWSDWTGWYDQPVLYKYEPYAIAYKGKAYVFYVGYEYGLYSNYYDGYAWAGWDNAGGEYRFSGAPYAKVSGDKLYLIARGADSYVYYRAYDGYEWSDWARYDGDDYPYAHANDDYDEGYGY